MIGDLVVQNLRGSVGPVTLARFHSEHTFLFPVLSVIFMLIHFVMIRKQIISDPLQ